MQSVSAAKQQCPLLLTILFLRLSPYVINILLSAAYSSPTCRVYVPTCFVAQVGDPEGFG